MYAMIIAALKRGESRELDSGKNSEEHMDGSQPEESGMEVEEEEGQWYLGRAREEFQRRRLNGNAANQHKFEEEDPIEVSLFVCSKFRKFRS